jgi:hypothetical protein
MITVTETFYAKIIGVTKSVFSYLSLFDFIYFLCYFRVQRNSQSRSGRSNFSKEDDFLFTVWFDYTLFFT